LSAAAASKLASIRATVRGSSVVSIHGYSSDSYAPESLLLAWSRVSNVRRFLLGSGPAPKAMKLTLIGYFSHYIAPETTSTGQASAQRAANRRVEITYTFSQYR
jgi:outer membrane protein OmpA-like peptidoglycan-associated protein